jgi:hypothetical protein
MLWAIGRFRDSGLRLPSLEIYFGQGCQERFGAFGRFVSGAAPWCIDVCTTNVYLHELAHAWDCFTLTDTDRRLFLDLRGLDAWQGSDIPWMERGQEELARLVARVFRQGILNFPSEDQLRDLDHFEQITRVPAPVVQLIDPTDLPVESAPY